MKIPLLFILSAVFGISLGANILVLLPLPFTSHTLTFKPLFLELARRGHTVTYIGSIPLPEMANLHQTIVKSEAVENILGTMVGILRTIDQWGFMSYFWKYGSQLIDVVLDEPIFQRLIADNESHYDVIITEPYFLHEPLVLFGRKFNAPVVGIFPLSPTVWASYLSGNPMPFSFVPSYKTAFSDQMTFTQRTQNTLIQLYEYLGCKYYYLPKQEEVARNKIVFEGSATLPPLETLLNEVSLHLIDYHFSSSYNRPFENNVLQVGGLALARESIEPLSPELSQLMEKSKGVVFFSLGSHIKLSDTGEEAIDALMTAFAAWPNYQFLVKWDDDQAPKNLPANVKTAKWFPQPTVLGHPKCKLMIGHCGIHGIMESIHHGVPYIGIPQFSDQEFNARFIVSKGFGLRVGREELTSENLVRAINSTLMDPKYRDQAAVQSKIERDRIMNPLDLAVYGVEYVIRHKGAPHLRPSVLNLAWYQYLLLDVVFTVIFVPLVMLFLLYKMSKWFQ